jgi:penicillin-binding protein 1A
MVQAFSVFPNQGVRVEPFAILTVKDSGGHVLENNTPVGESVLDPMVAYIMVHTLKDVIDNGTGRIIRRLGFNYPAAGKTGTTNDNVDAWFLGFTPDLTCGVWVGYDERQSLGKKQTGGETAAPIWAEFMKAATAGLPVKDFELPKGADTELVTKKICLTSGLLAGPECIGVRDEIFKKETAPTKYCNIHVAGSGVLTTGDSTNGSSNSSAASGDILEMGSEPVVKANPTILAVTGSAPAVEGPTPTVVSKKAAGEQAYPDEGF